MQPSRWLLLIHQIPPKPNYLRIKIGRRLSKLGSVAIKNSVYALPATEQAQEDFEWLVREIVGAGGDASVCEARFIDGLSDESIEALFRTARDADYAVIAAEARRLRGLAGRRRKLEPANREEIENGLPRLKKRHAEIAGIDFFGATGRETVEGLFSALEEILKSGPAQSEEPKNRPAAPAVRGATWVTRRGIHVDRMASAWLIRRFIDPDARFKFVPGNGYKPQPKELRFDMFEAEFTHEGDNCTFEVLLERYQLGEPGLKSIAQIVHDIDLKDSKFGRADAPGIDALILGIAMANREDEARLELGGRVFDGLYELFRRKKA